MLQEGRGPDLLIFWEHTLNPQSTSCSRLYGWISFTLKRNPCREFDACLQLFLFQDIAAFKEKKKVVSKVLFRNSKHSMRSSK